VAQAISNARSVMLRNLVINRSSLYYGKIGCLASEEVVLHLVNIKWLSAYVLLLLCLYYYVSVLCLFFKALCPCGK